MLQCVCVSFLSVGGRLVVEEGHLEQREVEDGNSSEMAGLLLYPREGPWALGGMEDRGEVAARAAKWGHHRACVRTRGLVELEPPMTDQEVDARTAVEEV